MNDIRVLLIDDEAGYTDALAKRLDRRGLSATTASGGVQALEIMDGAPFDVVLLDIKMAGMDGINTLSAIKRRHPEVEVVMLTAHANTDIVISSLAMGAYDYLLKPADVEELVRKIEDAAMRKRSNSK
ncbi:response regulator receiver protein [Pseudodesulfovibrio mercurii]|uniref:Response regulator receiver protein n=1 Tax=Pseudodesulfovibrio mercurii TaxID=641491 RepID=F0JDL5_9BACT|nr:response regulator [Pseudodesulfovibrio mercurii]EGB13384.1 response regulator receiver protein [Pseudodesulfovibrio mercurii]